MKHKFLTIGLMIMVLVFASVVAIVVRWDCEHSYSIQDFNEQEIGSIEELEFEVPTIDIVDGDYVIQGWVYKKSEKSNGDIRIALINDINIYMINTCIVPRTDLDEDNVNAGYYSRISLDALDQDKTYNIAFVIDGKVYISSYMIDN
mgnify:CR=1 FL=1